MQGCMGLTFLCGWNDRMSLTDTGGLPVDLTRRSVAVLLLCSKTVTSGKLILEGETSWMSLMVS